MSSYDPIDEALNTTSAIEVSTTPENGCITRKDSTKNITDDVEKDYELSLIHISEPTRPY